MWGRHSSLRGWKNGKRVEEQMRILPHLLLESTQSPKKRWMLHCVTVHKAANQKYLLFLSSKTRNFSSWQGSWRSPSLTASIYRWINWGSKRLSDSPEFAQLLGGKVQTRIQLFFTTIQGFLHYVKCFSTQLQYLREASKLYKESSPMEIFSFTED